MTKDEKQVKTDSALEKGGSGSSGLLAKPYGPINFAYGTKYKNNKWRLWWWLFADLLNIWMKRMFHHMKFDERPHIVYETLDIGAGKDEGVWFIRCRVGAGKDCFLYP